MRIEHIALWSKDIEKLRDFYTKYLEGKAGQKYHNPQKQFESYFISFETGARLELMQIPGIKADHSMDETFVGWAHMAFSLGNKTAVDHRTEVLRNAGYEVVSEPRYTGDGYYESCVLDPDGNRIELTE